MSSLLMQLNECVLCFFLSIGFISDWLVFYHLGHEVAEDAKDYLSDLQLKVQKVSKDFDFNVLA